MKKTTKNGIEFVGLVMCLMLAEIFMCVGVFNCRMDYFFVGTFFLAILLLVDIYNNFK